jgi:phage-Barnase-EndoU-ColicinE5/D-RelE like nuclease2
LPLSASAVAVWSLSSFKRPSIVASRAFDAPINASVDLLSVPEIPCAFAAAALISALAWSTILWAILVLVARSVWNEPPAEAVAKGARAGIVRRYIATFDVDGETETVVVIVEIGSEGWTGKTWFPPKRGKSKNALADYLDNKVRGGVLQYRRADNEKGGAL